MCIRDRGDILRVKVEHADEYDLWGSRV
ncbi:hypothetical protein, partial [Escherichia coli]